MGSAGSPGRHGSTSSPRPGDAALGAADAAIATFFTDGQVRVAIEALETLVAEPTALTDHGTGASRGQAVTHVYLGLLKVCAGDIAGANRSLADAHDVFEDLDPAPRAWLLAHCGVATIAALRGDHDHADAEFERAVTIARELGATRLEAIARVLRAEVTAAADPRRAHVDARYSARQFAAADHDVFGPWAERTRAITANASGEHRAAALITERLLTTTLNPLERGRTLIVHARAQQGLGAADATATASREAVELLAGTGAQWFLVEALLLLAEAEPERAEALLGQARDLTAGDAAYARQWATRPTLHLEVLGTPRLLVGGRPLELKSTKTHKLLFCLALAGPRGREVDALAELFWPDANDPASNITTATWDARRGLGLESWRLHRDGSRLALDITGARFDLDEMAAQAASPPPTSAPAARHLAWRDAVTRLALPVLPAWAFEEWVIEADSRRASLLADLPATPHRPPVRPAVPTSSTP